MTKAQTTVEATSAHGIGRRGLMLVLSSPSGAGKSTLTRLLLAEDAALALSVSVTTRAPRPGEVDGEHYHFISADAYAALRDSNGLLEHAEVFDHHYGTPRAPVDEALAAGRDVLFDIDWQGTQQLRQSMRDDLVTIFVLPPSAPELERRLRARAQDGEEVIRRRMAKAGGEISHWAEYDYIIVNDDIDRSLAAVRAILAAERLKRERQTGLVEFVRDLMRGL